MAHEHLRAAIHQTRSAGEPGLEQDHGQAFVLGRIDQPIACGHGRPFFRVVYKAKMDNIVVKRNWHDLASDQNQFVRNEAIPARANETVNQPATALRFIHSADIEEKWVADPITLAEFVGKLWPWGIDPYPDQGPREREIGESAVKKIALK